MKSIDYVQKRDGRTVLFDNSKIIAALQKAVDSTNEITRDQMAKMSLCILEKVRLLPHPFNVEKIQDIVEIELIRANFPATAKAYILYREKRRQARENKHAFIDVEKTMDEYLNRSDWRVNANANQGYSLGGLILNASGKLIANYWLNKIYSERIRSAHVEGDMHIHDLDMFSGYCAGWSLRQLLEEGFNGVPGKTESLPPKHLESALSQMVNFLGTLQNEWAGAQAFSSFDTYLAPYVKQDAMNYSQVKQAIQQFVFNLNVPSRWGTQTPFTNITLDWVCPSDMKDQKPTIGKNTCSFSYGDCKVEMDMINKAFIEVMTEGDAKGRIFTFPIPTYNITKDFDWENENAQALFEKTAKVGVPNSQKLMN